MKDSLGMYIGEAGPLVLRGQIASDLKSLYRDFNGIVHTFGTKVSFLHVSREDIAQESAIDPRVIDLLLKDNPEELTVNVTEDGLGIENPAGSTSVRVDAYQLNGQPRFIPTTFEIFSVQTFDDRIVADAFGYIRDLRRSPDRATRDYDISTAFIRLVSRLTKGQS